MKLDNIKVAIFDFDETLAIHKDKDFVEHRNETEEKLLKYYLNAYLNPETFYDIIEPCTKQENLYNIIQNLRAKKVKMYCLSGMRFSFHLKAKENFLRKYYGKDIEVISAGSQDLKIEAVKIIQRINNCKLNEIIFIDDTKNNVDKLKTLGVNAYLPSEL